MADLKPCPFCGGDARMESGGPGCHYVRCDDCGACSDDGSQGRASGLWNTRGERALAERAGGVKVKVLEWVDGEAKTPFGSSYTVHRRADGMYEAVGCGAFVNGPHRDTVSAKAATQDDYERRILAAITTEPAAPEFFAENAKKGPEGRQETVEPAAWQWRVVEDGEPRSAWKGPDEGVRVGWEALAKRMPDKYVIEKRPLYTRPSEQAVTDEQRGAIAYALTRRLVIDMSTARAAVDEALTQKEEGR